MKINTAPRSDQWNADDFIGGISRTFTITDVQKGTADGARHDIHLAEGGGRVWRPPVTLLRLMAEAWGDESDEWIGKRVTLYKDPNVRYGADTPGGIRISHMSDLPGGRPLSVRLTKTRGHKQVFTVEPLPDLPASISAEQVADFQQRIADAASLDDLTVISTDLKAVDLGAHRKLLQEAWTARRNQLTLNEGNNK